jgi:hypothetical protein
MAQDESGGAAGGGGWAVRATGAGERGQCEGDTCAINGRRGVLIDLGSGKLRCIADEHGGRDYLRESADPAPTRDHAQNMAEITRPMIARWRPRGRAARRERSTALGADNIASSVLSQADRRSRGRHRRR